MREIKEKQRLQKEWDEIMNREEYQAYQYKKVANLKIAFGKCG
jgi:hypothetical protein